MANIQNKTLSQLCADEKENKKKNLIKLCDSVLFFFLYFLFGTFTACFVIQIAK